MSNLTGPTPGLIIASVLFRHDIHSEEDILKTLELKFGPYVTFHHSYFPMREYYSKEMGESELLSRVFIAFYKPVQRDDLVEAKVWADQFEKGFLYAGKREINLDMGLLTLENLVLATGKNYSHRPYLGQGVFADLTLIMKNGQFQTTPWTYPDYSHPEVIDFFTWARQFLSH
ncbi:hypothetical protein BIY24_08930 [Halobacteriovorax marinus]|uniref:DUF4416 family protein n=1 Tax=Halobacteriovorax marinus TaxID=97084 RepID=UPI000BC3416B|nr:DUF4416 family protein [Halobacteriovorax marinus]ATH08069.1 hypothetical protein BIY24_08930 [Halobacteriovorax marinus]